MTFPTMEVVVMSPVSAFVTGSLAGNLDAARKSIVLKGFERPVDRGNSKGGDLLEGQSMNLIGEERSQLLR
jgi:hypothetical protein